MEKDVCGGACGGRASWCVQRFVGREGCEGLCVRGCGGRDVCEGRDVRATCGLRKLWERCVCGGGCLGRCVLG